MRQSQSEIKAIEAELRSIRADKTKSGRSVTLLEPRPKSEREQQSEWEQQPEWEQPISPTITRPASKPPAGKSQPSGASSKSRSVECFPIPNQNIRTNVAEVQFAAVVDQLRQQTQPSVAHSSGLNVTDRETLRQILEEKAKQINSLSNQQETMIRELMLLTDRFEQELQQVDAEFEPEIEPICEYVSAEVPYIDQDQDGTLLLTTRSIDWPDMDWSETGWSDATGFAEGQETRWSQAVAAPTRRKPRRSWLAILAHRVWRLTIGTIGFVGTLGSIIIAPIRWLFWKVPEAPPRRKIYRGSGRRATATEAPFGLKTAVMLIAGSAALRIALDWFVATHPVLWMPSVLVMITPALFAVYRSTVSPQVGFAWGYRLFAIMIGLLLGGRL